MSGPYRENSPPSPNKVRCMNPRRGFVRPWHVGALGWVLVLAMLCYVVEVSGGRWWTPLAMLGSIGGACLLVALMAARRWPWEWEE